LTKRKSGLPSLTGKALTLNFNIVTGYFYNVRHCTVYYTVPF